MNFHNTQHRLHNDHKRYVGTIDEPLTAQDSVLKITRVNKSGTRRRRIKSGHYCIKCLTVGLWSLLRNIQ